MEKKPHDIDAMMRRIAVAVGPYPKAAMFELAERGYASAFEQLVACILSIRTYDEVSLPAAIKLFTAAGSPQAISQLPIPELDELIRTSSFHERKAYQIQAIARRVTEEFGGELPCDLDVLLSFEGVGPKCAHLALGVACGQKRVSADIHVHRVTNRWGYIQTKTPEQSGVALEAKLPEVYWIDINRLLVPFGKHICTGKLPRCSTCPVLDMCQQVGVSAHR